MSGELKSTSTEAGPLPHEPAPDARRGPWTLAVRPSSGRFSCAGCGPHPDSTGKPYMLVTGRHGVFDLCLGCAAQLRDLFLDVTRQR